MKLKYRTTLPEATLSPHALEGDVGLDILAVKIHKKIGDKTIMYDTGICVQPEHGYYTELIPRSSISKTGYILTNSVGIVDPKYRGTLKIVLTRVDDSLPELTLPFKVAQLIVRKAEYAELEQVHSLDETIRGDKGFGSTNYNF